jgi:hypothetical protein
MHLRKSASSATSSAAMLRSFLTAYNAKRPHLANNDASAQFRHHQSLLRGPVARFAHLPTHKIPDALVCSMRVRPSAAIFLVIWIVKYG